MSDTPSSEMDPSDGEDPAANVRDYCLFQTPYDSHHLDIPCAQWVDMLVVTSPPSMASMLTSAIDSINIPPLERTSNRAPISGPGGRPRRRVRCDTLC
jgi:hypothetical protein